MRQKLELEIDVVFLTDEADRARDILDEADYWIRSGLDGAQVTDTKLTDYSDFAVAEDGKVRATVSADAVVEYGSELDNEDFAEDFMGELDFSFASPDATFEESCIRDFTFGLAPGGGPKLP